MHVLCYMNMLAEINYCHCRSLPLIFAKSNENNYYAKCCEIHHNTRFTTTGFLYYSQVVRELPPLSLVITSLPLQVRNMATKRCIQLVWLGLMSVHPSLVSTTGDELRISIITTRPWDRGYAHPVCNYSTAVHERSLSLSVAGEI